MAELEGKNNMTDQELMAYRMAELEEGCSVTAGSLNCETFYQEAQAMSDSKELLGKIIDLMRQNGVELKTPYDFENWIDDNARHLQLFETGRFNR